MNKENKKLTMFLYEEHGGFAITLEVMATLVMITIFLSFNLYILRVMNVQRYMNTVLTSTASEASRWGGVNTNAYKLAIGTEESLLGTAQKQLENVAGDFEPEISGEPSSITTNGDKITITIKYHLPDVFSTMSHVGSYNMYNKTKDHTLTISVNSIMNSGSLLK